MPKGAKAALKGIFGEMLDDLLRVTKKSGRALDADSLIRHAGKNADKADHIPVFKVGKTKNLKGKTDEYVRQLQRQIDGLNSMTADELIKNMDEVSRGGLAQREAREKFRKDLETRLADQYRTEGMSRADARALARTNAADQMKSLAALHEPDIVAGGRDVIGKDPNGLPSMGDKYVNSSIGSQWRARRDALRAYAEQMQNESRGGEKLNLSFLLE